MTAPGICRAPTRRDEADAEPAIARPGVQKLSDHWLKHRAGGEYRAIRNSCCAVRTKENSTIGGFNPGSKLFIKCIAYGWPVILLKIHNSTRGNNARVV